MKHIEHRLQQCVATYLSRALPKDAWFTSVDAGQGRMDAVAGAIRRARGVKAGVPDVLCLWSGQFVGLELKADGGTVSDNQRRMAGEIIEAGGKWFVAHSVEEVESALRSVGVPLHATSFPAAEYDSRMVERVLKPKKRIARRESADQAALRVLANARKVGVFA